MKGADILAQVAAERGVSVADLRSRSKRKPLPEVRREVSCRLKAAGYSLGWIGKFWGVNKSVVCEHVYPHYRAKSIARRAAWRAAA